MKAAAAGRSHHRIVSCDTLRDRFGNRLRRRRRLRTGTIRRDSVRRCITKTVRSVTGRRSKEVSARRSQVPSGNLQWDTVTYVYNYVTAHMPAGNAGGLSQKEYVEIMAFLLKATPCSAGRERTDRGIRERFESDDGTVKRFVWIAALIGVSACSKGGAVSHDSTPGWVTVTDARLLDAGRDDGWLMYLRTYDAHAHAPFAQIDRRNVGRLHVVFTHEFSIPEGYEAPPIVNGRTMIVTTPLNHVYALDAVTGKKLWQYDHPLPKIALRTVCCDVVNRGVALYGDMAYEATLDNHVVALDARTGKVVWETAVAAPGIGYAMSGAPLAIRGKIIVGDGGGEYASRGFLVALDAKTGKEVWRFYTTPAPGEPGGNTWPGKTYLHGGADPWMTSSYDPETNTLFTGTGNPSPWLWLERKGQNLYSDSILALNPDTGKLKWYFQQTPNDPWDYDATATVVLADVTIGGRNRHVLFQASRNGWLYVIDRTTGRLIYMKPFTKSLSVTGYDSAHRIGYGRRRASAADRPNDLHLPGVFRRRQLVVVQLRSRHAPDVRPDDAHVHEAQRREAARYSMPAPVRSTNRSPWSRCPAPPAGARCKPSTFERESAFGAKRRSIPGRTGRSQPPAAWSSAGRPTETSTHWTNERAPYSGAFARARDSSASPSPIASTESSTSRYKTATAA